MRRFAFAAVAGLVSASAPVWSTPSWSAPEQSGPTGRWDREDGLGGIEIRPCADALCGQITWLRDKDTPAHIGQQVLFGMRRTAADTWTGSANNPEDGRTYAGSMTLDGRRLMTRGCLFGGLICKSVALVRPR